MEDMEMKRHPMMIPLVGLVAGILISYSTGFSALIALFPIFGALAVYFVLLAISRNPTGAWKASSFHYVWIGLFFIGIGMIAESLDRPIIPNNFHYEDNRVICYVEDTKQFSSYERILVRLNKIVNSEGCETGQFVNTRGFIYTDASDVEPGDVVIVPSEFEKIAPDPNKRSTGIETNLAFNGIIVRQNIDSKKIVRQCHKDNIFTLTWRYRELLTQYIEKCGLEKSTCAFIIAVFLGDRSYIDPHVSQSFADAGISHMLALSGMHVGIIASIISLFLFPLNFTGKYKLRLIITVLLLWVYAILGGMSPSIVRACLMTSFTVMAILIERHNAALNSLFCASLILLLLSPNSIFQPGFQLSFFSVASILCFAERLNPIRRHQHPKLYALIALPLVSISATAGTWALCAFHFSSFPASFLILNLVALPLLPFFSFACVIYLCLCWLSVPADVLGRCIDVAYSCLCNSASWIGGDGASVISMHVSKVGVIAWLISLLVLAVAIGFKGNRNMKKYLFAGSVLSVAVSVFIIWATLPSPLPDGFIIQSKKGGISLVNYTNDREDMLYAPLGSISLFELHGYTLIVADAMPADRIKRDCDILIVGRNCPLNPDMLISHYSPKKIICHGSILPRRCKLIAAQCDSLDIPFHSLADDGPVEVCVKPLH